MPPPDRRAPTASTRHRLPAEIWALGFVSLLIDVSSEMIHALLPVYLVVRLGATALMVGVIEGIAEATAAIIKVFSGALSDRIGRRKGLAASGYGLAAQTKPVFPLATSVGWLVAARFIDRVGKGIRGARRDARWPICPRGAAFGLRQSLDTAGDLHRATSRHRSDVSFCRRFRLGILGGRHTGLPVDSRRDIRGRGALGCIWD